MSPAPPPPPARGLACPNCGGGRFAVVRIRAHVGRLVRVRRCLACGARIRTSERPEPGPK